MLDYILHIDKELPGLIAKYGTSIYAILFAVIFAETGFVIFPFLPGDSLLFALGFVTAESKYGISFPLMFILLTAAAIIGNIVNYWVGKFFGERLFSNPNSKIFSVKNRQKTEEFFAHYGGKTIIITRFVPVVRAFAPFIAGMGAMDFPKFMVYNVIGGVAWVGICMFSGFFLGQIPIVKERFEIAILVLIIISVLPIVLEVMSHKKRAKKDLAKAAETVSTEE